MRNLDKSIEAILQRVESFPCLLLKPYYRNSIISYTTYYSVYQQYYPPVAVEIISNRTWHSNARLETYEINNMAFNFLFLDLKCK